MSRHERRQERRKPAASASRSALRRAAVDDALRAPGRPLDDATRVEMESTFARDFSRVRIHTGDRAAESAQAVNARAYTVGEHIAFGAGQYAPERPEGQELLAHELTHTLQQGERATTSTTRIALPGDRGELEADAAAHAVAAGRSVGPVTATAQGALQRAPKQKEIRGGGATPGTGEGADLIFIIRAPDDQFTNDVTQYVQTVLQGQSYIEVDNLDDIFDHLALLKARVNAFEVLEPAIKVRRIRIVAHGSTTGGVKMTPRGETARRWVTPQEVATYAQNSLAQATLAQVMAPGAQIEFWGCNIGAIPAAGEAWSQAFGAAFSATSETFKTGFDEFLRPADRGETGEKVPGHGGTWVRVTSTSEIDSRSRGLQASFNKWLMARYTEFVANGDILPIDNRGERLAYMRDLFDRSGGQIRHILIERKSDDQKVRPGNQKVWLKLWKTTSPTATP